MDDFITQILACENINTSTNQTTDSFTIERIEDVSPMNAVPQQEMDPDIKILVETYGPLTSGMTISLDIASACELLHKERRRSDTFKKLQKKLMEQYGVELRILSRKGNKSSNSWNTRTSFAKGFKTL